MSKSLLSVTALALISQLAGCGWHAVRPYERSHLNSPDMKVEQVNALSGQRERALRLHEGMRQGRGDDVAALR